MMNLIKAEWYQLRTRRAPKVWLFVGLILGMLIPLIYYLGTWVEEGVRPVLQVLPAEPLIYFAFIPVMTGTAIFLLIGLGNTAYHDETRNRTLINTVSTGHSRVKIYVSKFLSGFLLALTFLMIAVIGFAISGSIIFNGDISIYFDIIVMDTLIEYLPIWMMNLALFQIIYFFSTTNALMNLTILGIIAVPLLLQLLSLRFNFIKTIEPFVFTQLNPNNPILINNINWTPWIALVYFAIFMGIGIFFFKRREIK